MKSVRTILLASHGTRGARAAQALALDLCTDNGRLHHLVVVPDFWKGMLGDDWLNNAVVHERFGRYVENQLEREIADYASEVAEAAKARGLDYSCELQLGKPAECVAAAAAAADYDLVIVGSPRPKGVPGFRSRLAIEALVKSLNAPLLVVPYPR